MAKKRKSLQPDGSEGPDEGVSSTPDVESQGSSADSDAPASAPKDPFSQFLAGLDQIRVVGQNLDSYADLVHKHEKAILKKLLDMLVPIVRYIDDEIVIREAWMAGRLGGKHVHYPERGIVLVDNFSSQNDAQDEQVVNFTGEKVILTRSGRLVQVSRTGVWRKSGGEDSFWSIEALEIPVTEDFARDNLAEIVQSIFRHIDGAKERVAANKRDMEQRLALIRNIKEMLDSSALTKKSDPKISTPSERVEIGSDGLVPWQKSS